MTNCARHLALLPKRAHKLRIVRVTRQINDGSMPTHIENGIVIIYIYFGECLGGCKFLLDGGVFEEFDGIGVGFV